jgi:HD-GYP domain-containing protein (c-di-GMP phosphodiesterase class II)
MPVVPVELLAVIHDTHLAPEKKAELIRQHSLTMMKRLLEHPTAANIQSVKRATSHLVDLILKDDETTSYLINITSHDYTTYIHSVDVGVIAIALAKSVFRRSDNHDLHALGAGFFLHDLGKIHVNLNIINKPGKLSFDEMEEMKRHPVLGFSVLQEAKQITAELKLIVLQHHEKLNGSGYPYGLRGDDIHIYGRICAIADIFDAMTSKRPYKTPMPSFTALKAMRDEMIPHSLQKDLFEKFVIMFKAP